MILFQGDLLPDAKRDQVLNQLEDVCFQTISNRKPLAQDVIDACGILSEKIRDGHFNHIIQPLLERQVFTRQQLEEAVTFFSKEHITLKYQTELGVLCSHLDPLVSASGTSVYRNYVPLGILFHIAAGNAEGLPFYSVIEGLLAGNINILKLPSADDGLSVLLLQELIQIKPSLAPYIVVFDIPSSHVDLLKRLGKLADAIVVWGGDEAIRAARTLAEPSTQIISWGHKLSFAYITESASEEELRGLAHHICETNQILCSSCQGIFIDTQDMSVVRQTADMFLKLLEEENAAFPPYSTGIRGKIGISLYNEELETIDTHKTVLRGNGVSIILSDDHIPELSYMFRNCWIKPLPRTEIIHALKPLKGYLHTIGLICQDSDRTALSEILIKAGAVRITYGYNMSRAVSGEAHDGEYPLRRYCRVVEIE